MITLLHTADWQVGRTYSAFEPDDAHALAEARFEAVERLAALAVQHRVDAVLVAGDVFDLQTVSDKTIRRLFLALQGYPGPWLLLPGNHDAALAESVWTRAQRLGAVPPHVRLCTTREPVLLPGLCAVLPAPLTQRHTFADLTEPFGATATPDGLPRIGLAHGAVQGLLPEGIDSANPIAAGRAAQAGLDYLALGDWHGSLRVDARTWYAGTPETERFRDNASGQALLVRLDSAGAEPEVTPLVTGQFRWRQHEATLQVPSDADAVLAMLEGLTRADVLSLRLAGRADLALQRRLTAAVDAARARARALVVASDDLQIAPTDEDLAALHADGYVGEVLEALRAEAAAEGDAAARARDALLILAGLLSKAGGAAAAAAAAATDVGTNADTNAGAE